MMGFGAFLEKEVTEIRRTWRIWVIPGMLVFFGITSPIIAALTPALVKSVAASQRGVTIQLPTPRSVDAYAQFLKNLEQFVLIAVVISGAGVISGERSSGTALLALTKPLSRKAFVIAKIISQTALLVIAAVLGTVACLAMTAVIFHTAPTPPLLATVALWLAYATLLIVVMTLFSVGLKSRGAAAGAGLVFFFVTLLLSNWGPTQRYTFAGLIPAMGGALLGNALSLGWPVATATLAIIAGVAAAVRIFERQEL